MVQLVLKFSLVAAGPVATTHPMVSCVSVNGRYTRQGYRPSIHTLRYKCKCVCVSRRDSG